MAATCKIGVSLFDAGSGQPGYAEVKEVVVKVDGDFFAERIAVRFFRMKSRSSTLPLTSSWSVMGVWNEQALEASKEIILCEALIDVLTFWCAGYRNVTASYGVNGFTADHRAAFAQHGTERVYIAYDADLAGNKAAENLAEELIAIRSCLS